MTVISEDVSIKINELFDDIPALIAILKGREHTFEYTNKLFQKTVHSNAKIIGLPLRTAMPELYGQGIFEILDNVYEKDEIFQINEIAIDIDKVGDGQLSELFFNLIYKPIHNEEKNVIGIFIHAIDITDTVKTRLIAEKTKDQFINIINYAPVATALYTGRDMVIEIANEKMLKLWGKDASVINKKLVDALPELKDQPFSKILDDVFTTGITYHTNEQKAVLEIDNKLQPFWFNFTYKPLFNELGEVYTILNMALDVTYQVEAKQQLANAEEKLRSAIEVANLGTWEYDPSTEIVTLNERLLEWRGLSEGDVLTMRDLLQHDADKEKLLQQIKIALQPLSGGNINIEYDNLNTKTGEQKRLHAHGKTFFDEANKPILVAGIIQDVTTQRLTEIEFAKQVASKTADLEAANNDLLQLNANLEQFVYVASHDLQEPLRKINIFSDMLIKKSDSLSDETRLYIGKIEKAAKRMSLLINDLLEFSRISSKDRVFIPTNLNKLINDIKIDYELLINQKNATIAIDSLPVVEAIPLQMNQLFYNLIGNSLKFAKENEPLQINIFCEMVSEDEKARLKLIPQIDYCKITVRDNGIGFEQKYAAQIFEIFQRLHGKQEYAGTGIGLSLAKKIVDNHGGHISAFSEMNNGAIFNVILPITRKD